jgi:hypothetical protein
MTKRAGALLRSTANRTSLCITAKFRLRVVAPSPKGQRVEFDIEPGERGPLAKRVSLID